MSGSAGGGDEHAGVLQELFGPQWWTGRQFVLLVTAVFLLLPLVLRRRVGKFTSQLPAWLKKTQSNSSVEIVWQPCIRGTAQSDFFISAQSDLILQK